jgi:hypothetical protein
MLVASVVEYQDGLKTRMEATRHDGGLTVVINNEETNEHLTIGTLPTGELYALRRAADPNDDAAWYVQGPGGPTAVGPCQSGDGVENGTAWTLGEGELSCVSHDGIVMMQGTSSSISRSLSNIQRGPQDPALFALPPGNWTPNGTRDGAEMLVRQE